jgi:TolA-binding protein
MIGKKAVFGIIVLLLGAMLGVALADADSEGRDFDYAGKLYRDQLYDVAAQQYAEFIRRYPTSPRIPEAFFMQGECLFQEEDFVSARRMYQRVVLEYADSRQVSDAQLKTGRCYKLEGNLPAALENFVRVADLAPDAPLAPLGLLEAARVAVETGNLDRALGILERLELSYETSPHYFAALLLKAGIANDQENYGDAELALSKIPLDRAGDEIALQTTLLLAQVHFSRGFFEEGVTLLEERLQKTDDIVEAGRLRLELARLLVTIGDYSAARQALNATVSPATSSADWLELLGDIHYFNNHPDSALIAWGQISTPDLTQNFKIAWTADQQGFFRQARPAAFQVYQTADSTQEAFRRWALRWFLEHPEQAGGLDLPRLVREIQETEPAWALSLMRYYRQTEQWSQADYLVARLQPGQQPEADELALEIIRLRTSGGQYEMADRLCDSFIRNYPASPLLPEVEQLQWAEITPRVRLAELLPRITTLLLSGAEGTGNLSAELGLLYAEELHDDTQAMPLLAQAISVGGNDSVTLAAHFHLLRIRSTGGEDVRIPLRQLIENGLPTPWRSQAIILLAESEATAVVGTASGDSLNYYRQYFSTLEPLTGTDSELIRKAATTGLSLSRLEPDLNQAKLVARQALLMLDNSGTTDASELIVRAGLAEQVSDMELAASSCRRLLEEYPGTGEAAAAMQQLFYLPDLEEAERLQIVRHFQADFWYHPAAQEMDIEMARLQSAAGNHATALKIYLELNNRLEAERLPVNILPVATPTNEYEIGRLYLLLEQPQEALPHFLRYLAAGAAGDRYLDALFRIGEVYAQLGDNPRATAYWSYLLRNHPRHPGTLEAMRKLAYLEFNQEQPAAAQELFQRLEQLQPAQAAEYRFFVILTDLRTGQLERAKTSISRYLRDYKQQVLEDTCITRYRWEKGRYLLQQQQYDEAKKLLDMVLKVKGTDKYHDEARYELARLQVMLGNEETAISQLQQLQQALTGGELRGRVNLTLGTLYSRNGNLEQAVLAFRNSLIDLNQRSDRMAALSNLVAAYKMMNLPEAAVPVLQELLELSTDPEEIDQRRIEMGNLYRTSGYTDRALELFRKLLQTADRENSAAIQYYIGQSYYDRGDYETAIAEFLKVTYFNYHSGLEWEITAIYQAAQAYEQLGHRERAQELYRRIIADRGLGSSFGKSAGERLKAIESLERE